MILALVSARAATSSKPRIRRRPRAAMIIKYVLPVIALGLLIFAVQHVIATRPVEKKVEPPVTPASSPFANTVAGAGIVEAQTENIVVGTTLPGLVTEVFVVVGQKVRAGDKLFKLDDRQLQADLMVRKAAVQAAEADLIRLQSQPRREQIPIWKATVAEAEAQAASAADELRRAEELTAGGRRVLTEQELVARRNAYKTAKARVAKAKADLDLQMAGAWQYDLDVAKAAVDQAKAQAAAVEREIERLIVRALVEGEVLQVNVQPGEYVAAPSSEAPIVIGNVEKLHVRVDIDEQDIPRFVQNAEAWAVLKGNTREKYKLTFVRVEPYVVPKRSLTGENTERVDTRVLQVIYSLEPKGKPLFVGQQLDVYVDASVSRGQTKSQDDSK
jgi:HlyD family secretion protein